MENKDLSNHDRQLVGISAWNAKLLPTIHGILRVRQTRNGFIPTTVVYKKIDSALQFLEEYEHAKHSTIISRLALQVSIAEAELRELNSFKWYQFGKWIRSWWNIRVAATKAAVYSNAMAVVIDTLPDDINVETLAPKQEAEGSEEQPGDQTKLTSTPTEGTQSVQ